MQPSAIVVVPLQVAKEWKKVIYGELPPKVAGGVIVD